MTGDLDHYEAYYADKLWNFLPAVYRAEDTDRFARNGPLRELVNRIGAQAAVLRRSIDRAWEDQSIETCDDWVIPYLGDLLATNLTIKLDARGQRRDVAKTIRYRRRKGTLAILEEIAADLTGWDAKVVEFFRRLGRTRHGLDPTIGIPLSVADDVAVLQRAEGLVGPLTRTGIGGLADLRDAEGGGLVNTAFDEFFHTADFRPGQGQVGWHNLPRLGVFLWRLGLFGAKPTTPVAFAGFPECFTFDPTGRDVPLFVLPPPRSAAGSDDWVSPGETQLPGPITPPLLTRNADVLYGNSPDSSLAVYDAGGVVPFAGLRILPDRGRFKLPGSPPGASLPTCRSVYHYGFSSEIGAGPYDRRVGGQPAPTPAPVLTPAAGGTAAALPGTGTWTLGDSLTYAAPAAPGIVQGALTLRAANNERPLVRLPATAPGVSFEWNFQGAPQSSLVLDGLFISGGDVVLSGSFATVTLTCCTLDPGGSAGVAAQGRAVLPIHPRIGGNVGAPIFPRGVGGPIIIPPSSPFALAADGRPLVPTRLWIDGDVGELIISRSILGPVLTRAGGKVTTLTITDSIVQAIPASTPDVLLSSPPVFPATAAAALALDDGDVSLSRCTVLGQVFVHRLEASECILRDLARIDDTQHGGVRFSAWAAGSVLPRRYECVNITPAASLFTSMDFGQPGYAQLLPTADAAILPSDDPDTARDTISAGAADGSEMGAFARENNPAKERSLLLKFQEYMPAGLVPVVVHVT